MPSFKAEKFHADHVLRLLHARGLTHLRTRARGPLLTIESGPEDDAWPRARLRRVTVQYWQLEIATHTGRWEKTPFRDVPEVVVSLLADTFGWVLQPVG